MRVLVRLDLDGNSAGADGVTKLLRIENSGVDFAALLRMIASKLGVPAEVGANQEEWKLYLEGGGGKKALVEDASEIDDGDTLVLCPSRSPAVAVKSEGDISEDAFGGDNDDDSVETVPYELPKDVEVIEISSDDSSTEGEESDSDDDIDDSLVDDNDDDIDESTEEHESDGNEKPKAKNAGTNTDGARPVRRKGSTSKDPPLQVHMNEEDIPTAPGKRQEGEQGDAFSEGPTLVSSDGGNINSDVKNRIIKLLNTGFHDESNEHEAKNAMKLAQRLMRKHNLSQALLLKEREQGGGGDGGDVLKGGMVTLRIVYRKTQKPSQMARWIAFLMSPVADNFDVKCYKLVRQGKKCSVTFYGIYTNCQLAAYAFRVAVERISQMVAEYRPVQQTVSSVATKRARLSYALGVVQGITDEVEANIQQEKERREKKLERVRRAVSTGEAYEESDDDDDDEGASPGYSFQSGPSFEPGNGTITTMMSPPATSFSSMGSDNGNKNGGEVPGPSGNQDAKLSGDNLARRLEEMEKEEETALVLVNHREKVADEVLKERGIKLSAGRKRKSIDYDWASYDVGVIDSKEIDINQRAIRDDWTKKVKKEKM